jgi:pimeloyl-ACP methyl ester carboxylesterase
MTNQWFAMLLAAGLLVVSVPAAAAPPQSDKPQARRENFTVAGYQAFVILPPGAPKVKSRRWVWYAPTIGRGLPGGAEKWMFDRFHQADIAIAGIDVGESYGSPKGTAAYQAMYEHLTRKRGFHSKPMLLARSRGGLMLYNWAVEHPKSVGGIAGIYPVCNLASYPGVNRAAKAYEMTAAQLEAKLIEHNPIDRLALLAKAKVPILHIHGDRDATVPLESNSAELAKRYRALGGPITIDVIKGQGHNLWKGWFESQRLTDFIIDKALERPVDASTSNKNDD